MGRLYGGLPTKHLRLTVAEWQINNAATELLAVPAVEGADEEENTQHEYW